MFGRVSLLLLHRIAAESGQQPKTTVMKTNVPQGFAAALKPLCCVPEKRLPCPIPLQPLCLSAVSHLTRRLTSVWHRSRCSRCVLRRLSQVRQTPGCMLPYRVADLPSGARNSDTAG